MSIGMTIVNLFQVKTGLNQAMTGMGDEIKEFKSNTEEGPNQAAGDEWSFDKMKFFGQNN